MNSSLHIYSSSGASEVLDSVAFLYKHWDWMYDNHAVWEAMSEDFISLKFTI